MRSPDRSENLGSLNLERWEPFEQRVGVGRWGWGGDLVCFSEKDSDPPQRNPCPWAPSSLVSLTR